MPDIHLNNSKNPAIPDNLQGIFKYSGANVTHVLLSKPGTDKSDPYWQIVKYVYSGDNVIEKIFANNNENFAFRVDQYDALTYNIED